ncbi:NfeD family protein [Acinetobacter sp. B10A]|uniref:NfeD family protein n=1 Tax=Acinetobacter baretiae TaxID=2605383 RepID=UPI001B3C98F5|nr:NfeD family protein [Acinetobacter baretiae]MBF7684375.1 NfeD family protein [Acinetobacter baretiae]
MSVLEPWYWFVFGILLILSELLVSTFALLWFGVAALIVSVIYWLYPALTTAMQIFVWAILAIACTIFWFKYIKPKSQLKLTHPHAQHTMIGQVGMVIQNQVNHHIRIRFPMPLLGSDEWSAVCEDHVVIGDKIHVIHIKNHELIVQKH